MVIPRMEKFQLFGEVFVPLREFTQDDSPYWVYDSSILGQVWTHFSSFLSFHDVKFNSAFSPVKFSFGLIEVLFSREVGIITTLEERRSLVSLSEGRIMVFPLWM